VFVPLTLTVEAPCQPVAGTTLTWEPVLPVVGELVTFAAQATGTPPFTFTWTATDGWWAEGALVTHTFAASATYSVTLSARNECGEELVEDAVTVAEGAAEPRRIYLPLVLRDGAP
jgi:PKD repeat protein